jgi:endonuclease/exonuclease/phosphatase family metal-dependent hydrolase
VAALRVLTWNLFHGRSRPPSGASLLDQFSRTLAGWSWNVALLQEVPPWWPPALAAACGAEQRTALTSRNSLLPVRRALADRWPDLIKSNGGGANAVLVRGSISDHRRLVLRRWPERRAAQLVRLGDGACAVNFHGSTRVPLARDELGRLAVAASEWAGDGALVLGGDLNLRGADANADGLVHVAGHSVDHILVRGFDRDGPAEHQARLRGGVELSDHVPLMVSLTRTV